MTKQEKRAAQIEQHGADLNAIFRTRFDNVTLYKKLLRLERKAHALQTLACTAVCDTEAGDEEILASVRKILGNTPAVFINGDPRGYSLKIRSEDMDGLTLHRNWGGDGIVAPDFTGE